MSLVALKMALLLAVAAPSLIELILIVVGSDFANGLATLKLLSFARVMSFAALKEILPPEFKTVFFKIMPSLAVILKLPSDLIAVLTVEGELKFEFKLLAVIEAVGLIAVNVFEVLVRLAILRVRFPLLLIVPLFNEEAVGEFMVKSPPEKIVEPVAREGELEVVVPRRRFLVSRDR